ncbi:MAG: hypothetical protein Q7S12_02620 [bacterium]|nr:hypothetical protein [bacterium]
MESQDNFKSFADLKRGILTKEINQHTESLKEKFDDIPNGQFPSKLPNLDSISIVSAGEGKEKQIQVILFYKNKDNKDAHSTVSIDRNGIFGGDYPDLKIDKDVLKNEILSLIESISSGFWKKTKIDILPGTDEGPERQPSEDSGPENGPKLPDPDRLPFMENQPRSLFGIVNEIEGFNGYRGTVFQKGILLENERKGNAAFIIDLPEKIDVDEKVFESLPSSRFTKAESNPIVEKYWKPISDKAKTKKELLALGAERIVHTRDTWKEKLQQAIDKRS